MPSPLFSLIKKSFIWLSLALCLCSGAQANDHGGGGGGGEAMKFTVNVQSPTASRYLQVELVFVIGSPEATQAMSTLKPRVQHQLILLLSSGEADRLLTRDGKLDLMDKIVSTINEVIDDNTKTGIKEVLFTSFIIQ